MQYHFSYMTLGIIEMFAWLRQHLIEYPPSDEFPAIGASAVTQPLDPELRSDACQK